jgi:uncharacterized protein (DUF433 family)
MSARIIDRGRGPEVEGTRVTVFRIMDYLREESSPQRIAVELELTEDQVQAALDYIASHLPDVEDEYQRIMQRVSQPNPAWVEAGQARTPEELRKRLLSRRVKETVHEERAGCLFRDREGIRAPEPDRGIGARRREDVAVW